MDTDAMLTAGMAILKQKIAEFVEAHDTSLLTPELAEAMSDTLREAASPAFTAMFRVFLESYDDQRDLIVVDGKLCRFKREVAKEFETFFGKMTLERRGFQHNSAGPVYYPLDEAWGMRGHYATPAVREAMAFSCAHVTPEETAQLLEKTALFHPHPTAIKHVITSLGNTIEANREAIDCGIRAQQTPPEDSEVLAASLDGVTVLLNEKGKKAGRPPERPGLTPCGETSTAYRNAMVGSVSFYGACEEAGKTPPRLACHYTARMPEHSFPTFKAQFEAELEAAEAKCAPGVTRMIILDGARPLWNYVESNPLFEHYLKVVDFYHATEHLSKIAECLFGKGTDGAKAWYDRYRDIMRDEPDGVVRMMRSLDYYAHEAKLSKSAKAELARERGYFQRNKQRMKYGELRARGLPIGSGPVEAACKTLVKTRLGRSGMRWSRKGGQRILDLRTYVKSKRWDAAWEEIRKLERAA